MRSLDPIIDREGSKVFQQGQVFKLKAKGVDGQPLWGRGMAFKALNFSQLFAIALSPACDR